MEGVDLTLETCELTQVKPCASVIAAVTLHALLNISEASTPTLLRAPPRNLSLLVYYVASMFSCSNHRWCEEDAN